MRVSARNRMEATVLRVRKGAVNARVVLKTACNTELCASMTNSVSDRMELFEGERVVAFFKASHVLVASGRVSGISARNRFDGCIEKVNSGAVNSEVNIILPARDKIASIITNESVAALGLREGVSVVALIKEADVMIAKQTDEKDYR